MRIIICKSFSLHSPPLDLSFLCLKLAGRSEYRAKSKKVKQHNMIYCIEKYSNQFNANLYENDHLIQVNLLFLFNKDICLTMKVIHFG